MSVHYIARLLLFQDSASLTCNYHITAAIVLILVQDKENIK